MRVFEGADGRRRVYVANHNAFAEQSVSFAVEGIEAEAAGVAVEIGVLMLVYLNQAYRRQQDEAMSRQGKVGIPELRQAVIDGALLRLRPITMTVAAIVAGLLPIMLGSGTGSEVMRRIAAPMVGGMVSATLLTLLLIPAAFIIWRSAQIRHKGCSADHAGTPSEEI